ncbi:MAG: hypothetical protein AB1427_00875 [Thermodesulfobacteriota bacterium]
MTQLSADKQLELKDGVQIGVPVDDGDKIYGGALVCVNAAGYLVVGADTAGLIFMGVAMERKDNTSGADGALTCRVRRRGLVKCILGTAISQANVGDNVFLVDDQTVDLVANVTNAIFCGIIAEYVDSTHAWIDIEPAIKQADVATHIADTSAAHAASAISIADAGGYTAQTTVEAALQEIYPKAPVAIADPGDAGAIPVTKSGSVAITTAAAETRTIAIPGVAGITIAISLDVDGGDCVITAAAAINQTGNNTITLGDAGDTIVLTAVQVGGARRWRVVVNDGCSLTTV